MSSRASRRRAGQATRKRVKASCCQRQCSVEVVGGWNPEEGFRPPSWGHQLCGTTSYPRCPPPGPSSLRILSKMDDAQSVGVRGEGAPKPQSRAQDTLSFQGLLLILSVPLSSPQAACGLSGGNP